jgi:hypothetical protein
MKFPYVIFLDFYELTMQSPDGYVPTSDGYHYLSSTNIEKALAIINLMKIL